MSEFQQYFNQIKKREAGLASTTVLSSPYSVEEKAKHRRIGQELNIPAAVVATDVDAYELQLRSKTDQENLMAAPVIRRWLTDPDNAAIAGDDIESLSNLERIGKAFQQGDARAVVKGQEFARDAQAAMETSGLGRLLDSAGQQFDDQFLTDEEGNPNLLGRVANTFRKRASASDGVPRSIIGGERVTPTQRSEAIQQRPLNSIGQQAKADVERFEREGFRPIDYKEVDGIGAAVAFVAENLAASAPEMATSMVSGGFAPLLQVTLLGGEVNQELAEKTDLSLNDRVAVAASTGVVMSALETFGMAKIFGDMVPGQIAIEAVQGTLGEKLIQNGMSRTASKLIQAGIAEGSTELLQEGLTIGVTALSGGRYTSEEVTDRLAAAFITGGAVGAGMRATAEVPTRTGKLFLRLARGIRTPSETGPALQALDAQLAQSRLKGNDPDKFLEALEQSGYSDIDLFVSAQDVRTYFQESGQDDSAIERWGIDVEVFQEKLAADADLAIPVSDYASVISGTDDAAFFADNAVFDPDELSPGQLERANEEAAEAFQDAYDEAEAQFRADRESQASDAQVYDGIFSQLREAGRSVDVAEREATVWRSFYNAMAERTGEDALDLARRFGVRIQGPLDDRQQTRRRGEIDIMLNTLRSGSPKAEGQSLVQFLMSLGGLQDFGGELAALDAPKKLIAASRKQIKNAQLNLDGSEPGLPGLGLDDAARRAVEAGYFPGLLSEVQDGAGQEADLIPPLLEAIGRELAGDPTFLEGEGINDALANLEAALDEAGISLDLDNDAIVQALEEYTSEDAGQTFEQADPVNSEAFKAWFGDSKVVDDQGNPLVVLHGTSSPQFEAFRSEDGEFFFTDSQDLADQFGYRTESVYLSLQNPLVIDMQGATGKDVFDAIDEAKANGHDGVIARNVSEGEGVELHSQFVAFAPEQIKSVNNRGTFDPNDGRILYQDDNGQPLYVVHNLSEENLKHVADLGGLAAPSLAIARGDIGFDNFGDISLVGPPSMADPKARGVKAFNSDVYSPRQPRAQWDINGPEFDRLQQTLGPAARKLSEDITSRFYPEAVSREGLALFRDSQIAQYAFLESIGEAPRIKYRSKPDVPKPLRKFKGTMYKLRDNPDFEAAALQIVLDQIEAMDDPAVVEAMKIRWLAEENGKQVLSYSKLDDMAKQVESYHKPREADPYLMRNAIQKKLEKTAKRRDQFDAWIEDNFAGVLATKWFENRSGRKKPYELDELVRDMTRTLRDGEGFNYGVGSIRSTVAKQFTSVTQLKDARGAIRSQEEFDAMRDETQDELIALADKFKGYHSSGNDFGWLDIFSQFMKDLGRGQLREWQQDIFNEPVPDDLLAEARDFLAKLRNMPTEYFEIKMQRGVQLGEFSHALVPEKTGKKTVDALKAAGLKVVKYKRDNEGKGRTEALQKIGDQVFFQDGQNPRGSIQFPRGGLAEGETVINLFERANLSTFLHESGHFFLEAFSELSALPDASQDMLEDMATIRDWLGVQEGEAFQTEHHEKWARGFEQYLLEGKAPSLALADAFARFKAWLGRIYGSIVGTDVKINPEIRDVMDRMLATKDEIATARDEAMMNPLFGEAPAGMSAADFKTYQRMARRSAETAEQRLLKKTMEQVRRQREKWYKAERASIRNEVEAEVNARPEYRLIEMLANKQWLGSDREVPDMQIDRAMLKEMVGDGVIAELGVSKLGGNRAIYGKDGSPPQDVANFFGFQSVTDMVETLQNTMKRKDYIELETDRKMTERYGDPLNDGSIENEAVAAIHTDQQAMTVAAEARQLNRMAGRPVGETNAKIFRRRAKAAIAKMSVRDVMRPDVFLKAERAAAREAEKNFAQVSRQGSAATEALVKAAMAKERQLLNHYLFDEARKTRDRISKGREKARSFDRKKVRDRIGPGYIEQIDALLDRFDFRIRSNKQIAKAESLRDFMRRMEQEGREKELNISDKLLDESRRMHFTRLPVPEMLGLLDTLDNLEHMGKFKQKLIDAKRKRDLNESADKIVAAMDANLKDRPEGRFKDEKNERRKTIRDYANATLTAETLMRELDGFQDLGDVYQELKGDIDDGMSRLTERRLKMAKDLDKIYGRYTGKEQRDNHVKRSVPSVNDDMSKWQMIAVALNTGNYDNYERLTNPATKHGYSPAQVDAILANLTEKDWRVVQDIWDYLETFWPEIAAKEKRQTGTTVEKVETRLMIEGAPKFVKGGYYPIKYDPRLSGRSNEQDQINLAEQLMGARYAKAQTRNGHTKTRAKRVSRALELDLAVFHSHLDQVLYDLEIGEAVNNTQRLLSHPKVQDMFLQKGKQPDLESLEVWLQDVAAGEQANARGMESVLRHLRTGFTVSRLAVNVSTALIQPSGLAQSAVVLGKRTMAKGMLTYAKRAPTWSSLIDDESAFMRERKKTFERDVFNVIGDLETGPVTGRWAKFHRDFIVPFSFFLMSRVQYEFVDKPTWVAAYQQEMGRSGDEKRALKYADRMVARAQGSGLMSDRGALERGTTNRNSRQRELPRMFTALGSYMFAKGNVAYERTLRTNFKNPIEVINYAADLALLFTFEALLYSVVKGFGPEEDEEFATWLLKETGFSMMSTVPLAREVSGAIQGFGSGGILGSSIDKAIVKPITQMSQGEYDQALVKSFIDAGGIWFKLPSSQTNAILQAVTDDDMGIKRDIDPFEVIGVGVGRGNSLADYFMEGN